MKNVPNILSALRIVLTPVFLFLYWQGSFWGGVLGLLVFSIAAFTDFLDGYLARRYNLETPLGTFLDPLADKMLTFSAFISLIFIEEQLFPWWAIALIIFRDVFITVMRIVAKMRNTTLKTRKVGKIKTVIHLIFLFTGLILGVLRRDHSWLGKFAVAILSTKTMYVLTILVMLYTVYTGLEYVIANRRLFKKSLYG